MLFPVPPVPALAPATDAGTAHAWLELGGVRVEAFLLPSLAPSRSPAPLVIYAHGNGELVDYWLRKFTELQRHGTSVLLVEYPGYGRSTGVPSEVTIQRALVAGYDWAVARPEIDSRRVIGYGRSHGGGAICALGRVRSLAALVLESAFTSIRDVAADTFGVPRLLVGHWFDNLGFVSNYSGPLLVLHGQLDASIPIAHARDLAAASRDGVLHELPCGHNDCPDPTMQVVAFLASHDLLPQ